MTRPSLLRSTLVFSGGTLVSRILGLVREQAIAYAFGANAATDAFWVAFRIPNFLRRLFAEGSFSVAFVPVFTEVKEKRSHADLKALVSRTAGTLGGVLLLVTALGVIGAGYVARGFAPGSIDEPAKLALTTDLLRITFPFLLFVSLTALAGGVLNSFHKFGLPALTPVILNLCMIAGALWLAPHLHAPIMALGWAIFAAGILQLIVQLPALRRLDLLSLPRWGWNHPGVRRIMRLMLPTLFSSSISQLNLLLDTIVLSLLVTKSQTWIYQATRFLELPLGVFGVALGTVILPALSRHYVADDREGFSKALDWALRTTLLIALPAMLALMLLAEPVVATFFQNGEYTAFDTHMTATAIVGLAFGVPAIAMQRTLLPAFYSRPDTKTPVRAGVVALVSNMVFNFALIALLFELWAPPSLKNLPWLQGIARQPGLHVGLAFASSLSNWLNCLQLWHYLKKAGVYRREAGWMRHGFRLGTACTLMVAVLAAGLWLWPWQEWTAVRIPVRAWHLAAMVIAGAAAFVAGLFGAGFRMRDLRAM